MISKNRPIILLASLVLAACSSSTEPTKQSDTAPPIAAGFARFEGTIHDVAGAAISSAEVLVPFGARQAWGGSTDAQGHYRFDAKVSDYAGVNPVAMVVHKDGYLPRTYYYPKLQEGATFGLTTDASNAPRPLAANEFVPVNAYSLWHVGDNVFTGSTNSQLQVAASGTSLGFPIVTWTSQLGQQYHTATIQLVARGVETSTCPGNLIGVYVDGGNLTSAFHPSDSDLNGNFTRYRFTVTLPTIAPGAWLMFGVISAPCSTGDKADDFEFAEVLVTLN